LVEIADRRILVDPGNFSNAWHSLVDLDVVIVTHQHLDHLDPQFFPALLERNPQAKVWVEPQVLKAHDLPVAKAFDADTSLRISGVRISAVGGQHAIIHKDIPRIGNVGFLLEAEGEPTFFHPGDSLATIPSGVDVAAIPAYGPWAAMKETICFARQVGAPQGFLVHEGLLNERGWALAFSRINDMTPTKLTDIRDGRAWEPSDVRQSESLS
jgi:L-ascorbate metabolism protein UlaG (beta-lactamase superfamily)